MWCRFSRFLCSCCSSMESRGDTSWTRSTISPSLRSIAGWSATASRHWSICLRRFRMPTTMREHESSLHQPALCELLPLRDVIDDCIVRTSGAFVAGYDLGGIHSYYYGDEMRNRMKNSFETLVRSLPERSIRMQCRLEIVEGLGDLRYRYNREQRSDNPVLQSLDRQRFDAWSRKERSGFYLRPLLHAYFHWDPRIHHQGPEFGLGL